MLRLRQAVACALVAVAQMAHAASFTPVNNNSPTAHAAIAARALGVVPNATPDPRPPETYVDSIQDGRNIAPRAPATTATVKTITAAASLPSTVPEYSSDQLFTSAILNSTNFFRREHNATDVVWNATIAAFANEYLHNDTDCTFAHSGGPFGENIAVGYLSVHGAVDAWGNERDRYDYSDPGFSETTGHFTQLVWKRSTTVGCGRRLCGGASAGSKSTGWFLVCEYWPRGNVIGQFAEEVDRQTSGKGSGGNASSSAEGESSRPSSGVITGAIVVLCLIAAAFFNDVRIALADT